MDINDLSRVLEEGKLNEAVDQILGDLGEVEKPENKVEEKEVVGEVHASDDIEKVEAPAEKSENKSEVKSMEIKENTEVKEDTLEVNPEAAAAEEKHEDGVAEPVVPTEEEKPVEEVEVKEEEPKEEKVEDVIIEPTAEVEIVDTEKPTDEKVAEVVDDVDEILTSEPAEGEEVPELDKAEVEVKDEEPKEEEKSSYDLVTESLDSILRMLREEDEVKPEEVVDKVEDKAEGEEVAAEEVKEVEIKEDVDSCGEVQKSKDLPKEEPEVEPKHCEIAHDVEEPKPEEVAKEVEKVANACSEDKEDGETVVVKEEDEKVDEVKPELENDDVYCDVMEPAKSEDVEEVEVKESADIEALVNLVTEAATLCKEKGLKGTKAELCEAVKSLLEEGEAAKVGEPAEKEFCVDSVIASEEGAEMGTEENEKHIEDAEVKTEESVVEPEDLHEEKGPTKKDLEAIEKGNKHVGEYASGHDDVTTDGNLKKKAVQESVNYTSLKDACMLDEEYFNTDTYTINTADEKLAKLTEQVSLLIARENNDPMYNELLKEAVYAKRLQEALVNKYHSEAELKAAKIAKKKN